MKNEFSWNLEKSARLPIIRTDQVDLITESSARINVNIEWDGGSEVSVRGICYSQNSNPTLSDSVVASGSGQGYFSCIVLGLSPLTTYYVRAFGTNNIGTEYGNELSFTTIKTPAVLASLTTTEATNITGTSAITGGNVTNDCRYPNV